MLNPPTLARTLWLGIWPLVTQPVWGASVFISGLVPTAFSAPPWRPPNCGRVSGRIWQRPQLVAIFCQSWQAAKGDLAAADECLSVEDPQWHALKIMNTELELLINSGKISKDQVESWGRNTSLINFDGVLQGLCKVIARSMQGLMNPQCLFLSHSACIMYSESQWSSMSNHEEKLSWMNLSSFCQPS